MTNRKLEHDHNIYGSTTSSSQGDARKNFFVSSRSEAGYTLVALLALMTVLSLFAMAVAPSVQQQAVREREREAIFRGEQVSDAIAIFYRNRLATLRTVGEQALPTSMDQLLEGAPIPGAAKNRQILRVSATRDPLSPDGEWRLIHPRTNALLDFQTAVMIYAGNVAPVPRDRQIFQLQQLVAPQITRIVNLGSTNQNTAERSTNASTPDDDSTGPFVGVATRNTGKSVLTYYGIEQHEQWIFTPLFRN